MDFTKHLNIMLYKSIFTLDSQVNTFDEFIVCCETIQMWGRWVIIRPFATGKLVEIITRIHGQIDGIKECIC